jgi:class 3 adenylate cyclase
MLAFHNLSEAVAFGLRLHKHLWEKPVAGVDVGGLLQIGAHEGTFTSMGPHQSTGRADYFGKVVNRAARIAAAAKPGRVYVGVTSTDVLELVQGLDSTFVEWKKLKGVQEEMALHACFISDVPEAQ